MNDLTRAELARRVELGFYQPAATRAEVQQACALAREQGLGGICVNGTRVELAASLLEDSGVKVTCLVGFPFGATDTDTKRFETEAGVDLGAHEIEVVLNLGRLRDGDHRYVLRELRDVAEAADERRVKVLLETSALTHEEIRSACALVLDSGAHCIGTGANTAATVAEIQLLRAAVGAMFGVKASSVADAPVALALLSAGATRIGAVDSARLLNSHPGASPLADSPRKP